MVNSKFFEGTEDLVAAAIQAIRVLRKHRDIESRMICDNLIVALRQMGVTYALKNVEMENKDAA